MREIASCLTEYQTPERRVPRHIEFNLDYQVYTIILPLTDENGELTTIGNPSWRYVSYPFGESYFN